MSKNQRSDLQDELKPLLEKSIAAEAEVKIWETFEKALNTLDESSQILLRDFFAGATPGQLSIKHGLSEQELGEYLSRAKRQLLSQIQRNSKLRQ